MELSEIRHIHTRSGEYCFQFCRTCSGPLINHRAANGLCNIDPMGEEDVHEMVEMIMMSTMYDCVLAGLDRR
jgi:hypothetical protein